MEVEKGSHHPRSRHRARYDFASLCRAVPELRPLVTLNKFGNESIDFSDPHAVKILNKALLKDLYDIEYWDIPDNFLCPPVPGRADYIHHVADLVNGRGEKVRVLDIGIGANCIYPIVGMKEYGWSFVGSDVNPAALESARKIVDSNELLQGTELRLQKNPLHIFKGIVGPGETFDLCICNPPFHGSEEAASKGTQRKWRNLGKKTKILNFGGQSSELWCEGGEEAFIKRIIRESAEMPGACRLFTTLVSKKATLEPVKRELQRMKALDVQTIDLAHGQKVSRILCWRMQ